MTSSDHSRPNCDLAFVEPKSDGRPDQFLYRVTYRSKPHWSRSHNFFASEQQARDFVARAQAAGKQIDSLCRYVLTFVDHVNGAPDAD